MNTQKHIAIVIIWILLTTLGGTIGLTLGSTAGEQIGFPIGYQVEDIVKGAVPGFPSDFLPSMVAGLFYGSVAGLIPGFLQWLFIRRTLKGGSIIWVFLNLTGVGLAFSLNSGLFMLLTLLGFDLNLVNFISTAINGLITGFILGILHWLYFRRLYYRAFWWIIFDLIGWLSINFLFTVFLYLNMLAFGILEIITNGISALLLAIFTGIALHLTLSESKSSGEILPAEG